MRNRKEERENNYIGQSEYLTSSRKEMWSIWYSFERNWEALKRSRNRPQRNEGPKEIYFHDPSHKNIQLEKGAHGPWFIIFNSSSKMQSPVVPTIPIWLPIERERFYKRNNWENKVTIWLEAEFSNWRNSRVESKNSGFQDRNMAAQRSESLRILLGMEKHWDEGRKWGQ